MDPEPTEQLEEQLETAGSEEEGSEPEGSDAAYASLRKFQKELNAGAVSLVLLALLGQAGEPVYGYQIAKKLEALSAEGPQIKQGTLYPVLRSLQVGGLLTSRVEPSVTGPPRRYYSITPQGREALVIWRDAWQKTRSFIDAVVEGGRLG